VQYLGQLWSDKPKHRTTAYTTCRISAVIVKGRSAAYFSKTKILPMKPRITQIQFSFFHISELPPVR